MKKKVIIIISFSISLFVGYVSYVYIKMYTHSHHIAFNNNINQLWFIKDSVKCDFDTVNLGARGKNDNIYFYNYKKNKFQFVVWKFGYLGYFQLEDISFNQDLCLGNIEFESYQVIDIYDSLPQITCAFEYQFNNSLNIIIDKMPQPVKLLVTRKYKGFFGEVNKIVLSDKVNGIDKYLIKLEYFPKPVTNLFLTFKGNNFLYIVTICSTDKFDESIINIFNLK